jgi:hypothetical protein
MFTKTFEECGDTLIHLSDSGEIVMELFCKECTSFDPFTDIYPNYGTRLFFLMQGLHLIL